MMSFWERGGIYCGAVPSAAGAFFRSCGKGGGVRSLVMEIGWKKKRLTAFGWGTL